MSGSAHAPLADGWSHRVRARATPRPRRDTNLRNAIQSRPAARDPGLALRDDGGDPRARHRVHQPATPGRTSPCMPRVAARRPPRSAPWASIHKTDWLFPQYREIGAFLLPRYHAGPDGCGVAGQLARRAGLHREVLRALSPSRSAPNNCMPWARRWPPSGSVRTR